MYGGDVRINEFEKFNGINLFPLDVLNVKESLTNFHKEYGFNKFDVIRCSNLLGHFKKEKREIIKNNLIEIGNEKALILFNTDYENIYTLYIKRKNEIKTKFIY
jgi:chemotaxis methyl-accepting protein methylase